MKRSRQCPKCESKRVGYFEKVVDQGQRGISTRKLGEAQTAQLMGLAVVQATGEVEAFVCTDCGYFEEYVKEPQSIDWSSMRGFRLCWQ
jgi:DNA-directed RNA polymerase subunit M/transcription elongation factor TFIIS